MASILQPQPRLTHPSRTASAARPLLSPLVYKQDAMQRAASHKRALMSPPRLATPIDLFDPRATKPSNTKPSTPCSPSSKRRRGLAFNPVRTPRRRHCARMECPISPLPGPAFFDNLPWVSQLEETPDLQSSDIADLSLLTDELSCTQTPCTGPVRRRKTSLRSNPLSSSPSESEDYFTLPTIHSIRPYLLLPSDRLPSEPRTPPPRNVIAPSEVRFHALRPVLPMDVDDVFSPSDR